MAVDFDDVVGLAEDHVSEQIDSITEAVGDLIQKRIEETRDGLRGAIKDSLYELLDDTMNDITDPEEAADDAGYCEPDDEDDDEVSFENDRNLRIAFMEGYELALSKVTEALDAIRNI